MHSPDRRLWHRGHGINFSPTRPQDASHPRVDTPRFLHTTTAAPQHIAAAISDSSQVHDEDEDGSFLTAPEFQPDSDTGSLIDAPAADDFEIQAESEAAVVITKAETRPADPPTTDLEYKVALDAFREAQQAPEGSPESFWSHTIYRGPDEQKVKVHYCKSQHTMERVCQYFLEDKVLGFDLEWSPLATRNSGPRDNVSLIQLANESRIALFHVSLFPEKSELVSPTFRKIMEDPEVLKTGVAIKGDCTRVRKHLGVDVQGAFELSHLYKIVKYSESGQHKLINMRLVRLDVQVEEHLGLPLYKGDSVRSSDWTKALNMKQVLYSASDAYAGFQLYHVLEGRRRNIDPALLEPKSDKPALPQSVFSELDAEGDSIAESIQKAPPVAPKKFEKDPRVSAADSMMSSYRASVKTMRAAPSAVRSYFIWKNNDDLDPEKIAKILRDPPLKTMTVVSYIMEAIKLEDLPFDKERLRNEIFSLLPKEVLQVRYKTLLQRANEPGL
ncbi:3'-5' exonuclease [Colletotrichum sojae]|uniref:3'-5' exonuclease n=1 Tax=Colletotrichum sojae TaxID=2175907 RepID=A0A8H6JV74_9PEZI|nr:3'-5' exonuclease [Colletotrichum sojae]